MAAVPDQLAPPRRSRRAASRLEQVAHDPLLLESDAGSWSLRDEASEQLPSASTEQEIETVEPGLQRVRVRVTWTPPGSSTRDAVELETLVVTEVAK